MRDHHIEDCSASPAPRWKFSNSRSAFQDVMYKFVLVKEMVRFKCAVNKLDLYQDKISTHISALEFFLCHIMIGVSTYRVWTRIQDLPQSNRRAVNSLHPESLRLDMTVP